MGNRDHPGFATLADERDPPGVKIDFLGAQVHHLLEPETFVLAALRRQIASCGALPMARPA
jgi:hypothetical protein